MKSTNRHNTTKESKRNIVLVQAYPANENLSSGLIEYLNQYFNVHFINLPGFVKDIPPLKEISMANYVGFLENRLNELNLDKYILGGMSFGFSLVSKAKIDQEKVTAIIGLAPFINFNYLRSATGIKMKKILVELLTDTDIVNRLWYRRHFRELVKHAWIGRDPKLIETVLNEVHPDAFIKTGHLIVKSEEEIQSEIKFQKKPHILIINKNDETINSQKVLEKFYESLDTDNLRVIFTDIPHYPKYPTFDYFKKNVKPETIEQMIKFLDYVEAQQSK